MVGSRRLATRRQCCSQCHVHTGVHSRVHTDGNIWHSHTAVRRDAPRPRVLRLKITRRRFAFNSFPSTSLLPRYASNASLDLISSTISSHHTTGALARLDRFTVYPRQATIRILGKTRRRGPGATQDATPPRAAAVAIAPHRLLFWCRLPFGEATPDTPTYPFRLLSPLRGWPRLIPQVVDPPLRGWRDRITPEHQGARRFFPRYHHDYSTRCTSTGDEPVREEISVRRIRFDDDDVSPRHICVITTITPSGARRLLVRERQDPVTLRYRRKTPDFVTSSLPPRDGHELISRLRYFTTSALRRY